MPDLEFEVEVNDFLAAASKVNQVVPAKCQKPALENMLLQVIDGVLEVLGSDLVVAVNYKIPTARVISEGSALISGARLVDLLKQFKGETAKVKISARGHFHFCTVGGNYELAGGDPRDYPTLPRLDAQPGFPIKGADLVDMVAKTEFAVSPDQVRGLMTQGVLFELKDNHIRLVATDTRRLAIAERIAAFEASLAFNAIVPINAVRLFMKVVSKDLAATDVEIGLAGPQMFVRTPLFSVGAAVFNSQFPPYESALGLAPGKSVELDRASFRTLLQRACLVDDGQAAFRFDSNKLTLVSKSRMVGASSVDMVVPYTGPRTSVGFNPKFVDDGLAAMKGDRVKFSFENHLCACIVRELAADNTELKTYCYMVMPMHIDGENIEEGE